MGGDLTSQWEVASRLQLELERCKRMENDYRRDLASKNQQIEDLKSDIKSKTGTTLKYMRARKIINSIFIFIFYRYLAYLLSDVAQVNAEKQSLEQEITTLRLQLERAERQIKVESSRLNAEISSLRQRLDRADSDLLHSRRENIKLTDQVEALEKEVSILRSAEKTAKVRFHHFQKAKLFFYQNFQKRNKFIFLQKFDTSTCF